MKMLYEIFKFLFSFISFLWLFSALRHFREKPNKDNQYLLLLDMRKDSKRLCFFTFILGVIAFILTCFEFYLKIKLNYNFIGILDLICYIIGQINLKHIDKEIEKRRKFK